MPPFLPDRNGNGYACMKFRRLKLTGFKSFVEPSELLIEPGLTGIVGPNGCGKSNLLEALRWVMGENSYKSMRASTMEDVIFAGSRTRPPRNMAEVVLTLDNSARKAPPPWNEADTLEVSRRIERDRGSTYRINGKEVRARDVQLLFADASTGARSPALVRQGRISEIINAKPQARRRILEEAAGITGLYTRRHEAELKLNAAEANLERLDDVTAQLESQLASLKRQARQATRYRDMSRRIRQLEAAGLWRMWEEARDALAGEEKALAETSQLLARFTRLASELSRRREELMEKLPPLREAEATRGAVLQRLNVEREALRRTEEETEKRRRELTERLEQAKRDMAREQDVLDDAEAALKRLAEEEERLAATSDGEGARAEAARRLQEAADRLARMQERHDAAQARHSELAARRAALERQVRDAEARLIRLKEEAQAVTARRADLERRAADDSTFAEARRKVEEMTAALEKAEREVEEAETALAAARQNEQAARQTWNDARREAEKLATEVRTLEKLLGSAENDLFPPLVDALKVAPGYETALAAALGDELEAPLDTAAPAHWEELPPLDGTVALPQGARPLAGFVEAPQALARRLSHIGLVESAQDGRRLQSQLQPGQRLVTREGDLWRWDGFVAAAEAPTAAARRLAERNRLEDLRARLEEARATAEAARDGHEAAKRAAKAAGDGHEAARRARKEAARALDEARHALAQAERGREELMRQLSAQQEAASRIAAARTEAEEELERARAALADLPDDTALHEEVSGLKEELERLRAEWSEARARHDSLQREAEMRASRLRDIAQEKERWQERIGRARRRMDELEARREKLREELQALSQAPEELERKRIALMNAIAEAERERGEAADRLAEAENALAEIEKDWREAEKQASAAREEAARLQARLEAAETRLGEIAATIRERMECLPEKLPMKIGIAADELPSRQEIERELTKLRETRERLGAVNLRAEDEMREVSEELEKLVSEREDVIRAIEKLRGGISSLNREGRRRLLEAFDHVNEYFASLFTTLFGGGKAHLELIESEDPLEAGLEIFAQPPGKRLQVLSLLSGGEQTLTAMALIFAVFLTNPSPICVLDEVDAPLDEHNVERFCNLLEDMLKRSGTDFLIITHHPITMARMNRLFGVTMMEPGVSRLVSVDLETAEQMREAS